MKILNKKGGTVRLHNGRHSQGNMWRSRATQGGLSTHSWKALGRWTGACQTQLLLRLIDRNCLLRKTLAMTFMSNLKEKKKTYNKQKRKLEL